MAITVTPTQAVLTKQQLSNVVWPTVTFTVPAVPGFVTSAFQLQPVPSLPANYTSENPPDPVFQYPDLGAEPGMTTITIPVPPTIDIVPLLATVPSLDLVLPTGSIDWAYEQYTNLIIDILISQLELLDGNTDSLTGFWSSIHNTVWAESFDIIAVMGFINPLSLFRRKEFAYCQYIDADTLTEFYESIRTKNLKTYISIKLMIEKQLRNQYASQKDVELAFAKDVVTKSVGVYNLAVKVYASHISEYQVQSEKYLAIIEQNDILIKSYETLIQTEELKGDINKSLINAYKIAISVRESLIDLFATQMDIVKKVVQTEAINIDKYKITIDTFSLGIKEILEQAQQKELLSEAVIVQAKLGEAQVWAKELTAQANGISGELTIAQQRYTDAQTNTFERFANLLTANSLLLSAANIESQKLTAEEEALNTRQAERVEEESFKTTMELDKAAQSNSNAVNEINIADIYAAAEQKIAGYKANLISLRLTMESLDYIVKKECADIMKNAKLINYFQEFNE